MTTSLQETIATAEELGEDWELPLFYAAAGQDVVRAGRALSITIGLPREDLAMLLAELWPSMEDPAAVVEELMRWPIAREGPNTVEVVEVLASSLAQDFADESPEEFSRAHELLVALEERNEIADDPDENWFVRGRIAYYLAGLRPVDSVEEFGQLFANAPSSDRVACRVWVTSLVLRQEYLLEDEGRVLAFYRAFRAYVLGDRQAAREGFEFVLRAAGEDVYTAISLHLLGVVLRRRDPERASRLLQQSIQLSEQLGLLDNELMARNSVIWGNYDAACASGAVETELQDLLVLARTNAQRMRAAEAEVGENLAAGVWRTALVMQWLTDTRNRTQVGRVSRERVAALAKQLRRIRNHALTSGDLESAILTTNDAAGILRDFGDYDAALKEVAVIIRRLEHWRWLPIRVGKLSQTVGSVLARSSDPETRAHGAALLAALDDLTSAADWLRSSDPSTTLDDTREFGVPS